MFLIMNYFLITNYNYFLAPLLPPDDEPEEDELDDDEPELLELEEEDGVE